ncbi:translation initiation factor IF-3 [Patescibacteria group bacterium]|nr:translation initiation factor IF-3 [Patescibacteria group bacterium]MCG2694667.1 translation initiation factor IF-3 [Candidatus Parcubacteria bacterium]
MAYQPRIKINEAIKTREVRVITSDGKNFGVMDSREALKKAQEMEMDLIEISPNSNPPIAKIMDYGKFQYEEKKKQKVAKAKAHVTETKVVQTKINTGEHDLSLKAKNMSKWLKEGNRIKLDLFLRGREKYMDFNFLKERINRVLHLVTEEYKIADGPKKSPKGLSMILEKK